MAKSDSLINLVDSLSKIPGLSFLRSVKTNMTKAKAAKANIEKAAGQVKDLKGTEEKSEEKAEGKAEA